MHASLSLLSASQLWADARARTDLVSFHGRYLSQWSSMVGPPDGSSRHGFSAMRQLLCLGGGLCRGPETTGSPTAEGLARLTTKTPHPSPSTTRRNYGGHEGFKLLLERFADRIRNRYRL